MRKSSLIAAGVSLGIAGAANAAVLPVQVPLFFSGNTAPSNLLREHVVRNLCNHAATINVYVDSLTAGGGADLSSATPLLQHSKYWTVQCTAGTIPSAGTLSGKTMAVYKSDGGSSEGATNVTDATAVGFLDSSTTGCTLLGDKPIVGGGGAVMHVYQCGTTVQNQIPDGGGSDEEPGVFVGQLAGGSGDFIDKGNLKKRAGPGLIFGPVVTLALRNKLQSMQGLTVGSETEANMPNLSRAFLRTLTEGKLQTWNSGPYPIATPATFPGPDGISGNGDDVPADALSAYFAMCRRVQGSGTHAEWMIHYHRTNCMNGSYAMPGAQGLPLNGLGIFYENSSAGILGSCLDALDKGIGFTGSNPTFAAGRVSFAIGYEGTDINQANSQNFRFVKVDGYAPTRVNAFNGWYDQVYFSGFQNRVSDYRTGALRTTVDATIRTAINEFFDFGLNITGAIAADIDNGGFTYSWGGSGYVIPSSSAPTTYNPNDASIPWTRENADHTPNSCQPLSRK
jgi:hypothetical protein